MNQQRALYVDLYSRPAAYQRAATRASGRALALIVGLLVLLALAGLLYLSQASTATEMRYALLVRRGEEARLQEEILLLRCQVAQRQSIGSLQERAQKLGFVDASPNDPQMVCAMPVASAPRASAPIATSPRELEATAGAPAPLAWLLRAVPGLQLALPKQ